MTWCRLEPSYLHHPKMYALCERLGDAEADRFLPRIWVWAAAMCESGSIPIALAPAYLEAAARWVGPRGGLFSALVATGWVDVAGGVAQLHDWESLNGAHMREARRDRERKAAKYKKSTGSSGGFSGGVSGGESPGVSGGTNERTNERTEQRRTLPPPSASGAAIAQSASLSPAPVLALFPAPPSNPKRARRSSRQADIGQGVEIGSATSPQAVLVEAWGSVFRERSGQAYRYRKLDFMAAAELVAQGVTPDEVRRVAVRAFRAGINPWLQVRNFKQLADRWNDVSTARVLEPQHNVPTPEERAEAEAQHPELYGNEGEL